MMQRRHNQHAGMHAGRHSPCTWYLPPRSCITQTGACIAAWPHRRHPVQDNMLLLRLACCEYIGTDTLSVAGPHARPSWHTASPRVHGRPRGPPTTLAPAQLSCRLGAAGPADSPRLGVCGRRAIMPQGVTRCLEGAAAYTWRFLLGSKHLPSIGANAAARLNGTAQPVRQGGGPMPARIPRPTGGVGAVVVDALRRGAGGGAVHRPLGTQPGHRIRRLATRAERQCMSARLHLATARCGALE